EKGIDDYLAAHGPEPVLKLFSKVALKTKRKKSMPGVMETAPQGGNWYAELIRNDKGAPKALLANAITVLRNAPEWQGVLAYNQFFLNTVTQKPVLWEKVIGARWVDADDIRLTEWL